MMLAMVTHVEQTLKNTTPSPSPSTVGNGPPMWIGTNISSFGRYVETCRVMYKCDQLIYKSELLGDISEM
ncbi:hypothetical protein Acr_28g0012010 [Actinidia rufa]|uniref:Uncharacterized protein n=1 Tax=Actinidia rufa TaxID=165716 RepID=A0A7J0HBN6_9ERIC|nr:hypothetical protein Acr_28g0012010 [Actinidia rufa]